MNGADRGTGSTRLLSTVDVGQANRVQVLQALADHGPSSRADLARLAGVPRATIGSIVAPLLEGGVLEERPPPPAAGRGKPARPLWFGPRAGPLGAVVVRAGRVETAVVTAAGEIVARGARTFPASAGAGQLDDRLRAAVLATLGPYVGRVAGVGLALPATCDDETGEVLACTPVPGLVGTRLPRLLAAATGTHVAVEEDARALAVGQRWFGQAKGVDDFAALEIGAGIGAGIVLGGRLHRRGGAVEVGHTCVDLHGTRCRCGLVGCWETVASLRWLRREAAARGVAGARATTPARLVRCRGEAGVPDLLATYADHVALGLANLAHTLTLRVFVLHGAVVGGGDVLLDLVQAAVRRRTLPVLSGGVRVELAVRHEDVGLLGAAATALARRLALVA